MDSGLPWQITLLRHIFRLWKSIFKMHWDKWRPAASWQLDLSVILNLKDAHGCKLVTWKQTESSLSLPPFLCRDSPVAINAVYLMSPLRGRLIYLPLPLTGTWPPSSHWLCVLLHPLYLCLQRPLSAVFVKKQCVCVSVCVCLLNMHLYLLIPPLFLLFNK